MTTSARISSISVVVADDDPLARGIVCEAVRADGLTVAAEAVTHEEAVERALQHVPDVLVLDVGMPGGDAVGAIRRIKAVHPDDVAILVLANSHDEPTALAAFESGAAGFLSKEHVLDALPRAVRALAAGEAVIPRRLGHLLLERMRRGPDHEIGLRPVRSPLTPREWEVFDLLCAGRSTAEIAAILVLSTETVRSHVKRILRKLQVRDRAEAIAKGPALRSVG